MLLYNFRYNLRFENIVCVIQNLLMKDSSACLAISGDFEFEIFDLKTWKTL